MKDALVAAESRLAEDEEILVRAEYSTFLGYWHISAYLVKKGESQIPYWETHKYFVSMPSGVWNVDYVTEVVERVEMFTGWKRDYQSGRYYLEFRRP